jgi:hypothetical protein
MISFTSFFHINESFDTVSDFLLNPEHRDKRWWDLMKEFEASGGKQIGAGKYGTVYSHPKWPYVIKTFTKDDPYLRFVRFAYKNPYPPFPKFYGTPKRIVPFYAREEYDKEMYVSRIEKLEPLEEGEFNDIDAGRGVVYRYTFYKNNPDQLIRFYENDSKAVMEDLKSEVDALPREIYNVLVGQDMLEKVMKSENWGGVPDWHAGNVMKRANGEYVLIDPVWEGYEFNAYRDHDEYVRQEAGYFDDESPDYVQPKTLRGGELPKKKRLKKPTPKAPVPTEPDTEDDLPF